MKHTYRFFSALLLSAALGLAISCKPAQTGTPDVAPDTMPELNISTIGIVDFDTMTEDIQTEFKGGKGDVAFRIFKDDLNKVMRVRMTPHSSVGQHSHVTDSEIIVVLQGSGKIVFDGQELPIREGQVHYCPKGHGHTIINDTDQELHLCCVVPQQ